MRKPRCTDTTASNSPRPHRRACYPRRSPGRTRHLPMPPTATLRKPIRLPPKPTQLQPSHHHHLHPRRHRPHRHCRRHQRRRVRPHHRLLPRRGSRPPLRRRQLAAGRPPSHCRSSLQRPQFSRCSSAAGGAASGAPLALREASSSQVEAAVEVAVEAIAPPGKGPLAPCWSLRSFIPAARRPASAVVASGSQDRQSIGNSPLASAARRRQRPQSLENRWRNSDRRIFPEIVFGSSSTK